MAAPMPGFPVHNMPADNERRRLPRLQLDLQVELVDQASGDTLGVLVNVHLEGFLMMGGLTLKPDHLYTVELRPITPVPSLEPVTLTMDCLWTRAMGQQDRVWAGCQIIDLAPEERQKLAAMIEQFAHEAAEEEQHQRMA